MDHNELFFRRNEPRWMNQHSPPYVYGGKAPRTELRVIMCCAKCEEKVAEEINELDGVADVFANQARSEVVVYGYADTHEIMKKARKIDKRAEIVSSDSYTSHHDKHRSHNKHHRYDEHKHSRNRLFYNNHRNTFSGRGSYIPFEISSPRYNQSHSKASIYDSHHYRPSSSYDSPDYGHRYNEYRPEYRPEFRPDYRSEPEYRHMHDDYHSEPEYMYKYSEHRHEPDYRYKHYDFRPEHEYGNRYCGYRPSQSYPPSYVERDFRDSPYPEPITNPNYMKEIDYY